MTIKRFKSFLEQNIAADYVAPADEDEEVKDYKPRSKGEEKFKNLHKVEVTPHPVAKKHQHTTEETAVDEVMFPGSPEYKAQFDPKYNKYDPKGEMRKKLALKPYGDREDPEDSPVSNQTKGRGRPRKYADKNEEVEQIDELEKDTLQSYAGKVVDKTRTMPQGAKKQKHLAGLGRAMDKMKKEEVEIEESSTGKYDKSSAHHQNARKMSRQNPSAHVTYNSNGSAHVRFSDKTVGHSTIKPQGTLLHTGPEAAKRAAKDHGSGKVVDDKVHFEEFDLEEEVMSDLKKIVEKKQVMNVKFTNGRTEEVDLNTAKAILELHNRVDEQNKMKIERMVNSSPTNFMKVVDLAMGGK